jgi:hypothetical protein
MNRGSFLRVGPGSEPAEKTGDSVMAGNYFGSFAALSLRVILGLTLTALCAFGQETQATASVSSDTVGVQDQLQLTITVSGKDSGDAEPPRSMRSQGFKVVSGPSVGTQLQWINGRTSSSKSFSYILIPEREGQFTIDPVEVQAGGKTYKTQPIQIRVTSAPASRSPQLQRQTPFSSFDPFEDENPPTRQSIGDALIVRAELDRNSGYPGQQVTLTYRIFTQVQITGIQLQENPPLSGFWVEDIQVDKNPKATRQVLNGREYQVFTIKKQALFANKTGRLQIPPSTFAISAAASGGLFSMFSRAETLFRKTQELTIDVIPLPEYGRPADFSNAVGSFALETDTDKNKVAAGEAVALRIKLEGRGNLKMIPDISLPPFPDFTIYSSKRGDNIRSFEQDQIGGDKIWEYVIVPKTPGRQTIPSLSFSFFNDEKNKYETVATTPIALDVVRGADSTSSVSGLSGADKQEVMRRGTDINFIKLTAGGFEIKDDPFYRKSWLYLILAFPLLFNAGAFLYVRQQSRLTENTNGIRNRNARKKALKNLRAAGKQGKLAPRSYYDLAASALSGYLADKFNLTEIELTEDNLQRALSMNSMPKEIIEETKACLRECDFGRFVSAAQSSEEMQNLSARIRTNIDALEKASASGLPGEVREPGITA